MASLKRKVHEVQAVARVTGLKQRRVAIEFHEKLDVALGQEGSAKKERRFAMPKAFTNLTATRVARDISSFLNDCLPLASSVTEGEWLQAFMAGRLQRHFGEKGKPPKPRTQSTQLQQRHQQSAQLTRRLRRLTGQEFDADKGPYVPYVRPSCDVEQHVCAANPEVPGGAEL
jgi:hypothetical protein